MEFKKSIPNYLTIFRIILIPILIISFYFDGPVGHWTAAIIFIFASITDYFDGFFARKYNAHSSFGKMFDPIADKLLVAATLMMLVHLDRAPVIPAILILCREIVVSGLREYLAQFKISVPVSKLAKIKTAIQMIAIITLLLGEKVIGLPGMDILGTISLWIAAALTLVTGYAYLKVGLSKTGI